MIDYKVGDIVLKKNIDQKKREYADRYMFLGTTHDTSLSCIANTLSIMGKVEIGIFIKTPVTLEKLSEENLFIKAKVHSVDLFEKDE